MINLFTYFNSHLNKKIVKQRVSDDECLFEPSDQSVKIILDFSRAYYPTELRCCDEKDMILN